MAVFSLWSNTEIGIRYSLYTKKAEMNGVAQ